MVKTDFTIILNEVKDLKSIKIRDSKSYWGEIIDEYLAGRRGVPKHILRTRHPQGAA